MHTDRLVFSAAALVLVMPLVACTADEGGVGGGGATTSSGGSGGAAVAGPSHVWSKAFGGGAVSLRATPAAAGDLYISGSFTGTVDFGGGAFSTQVSPVDGFDHPDAFVAKLDSAGGHVWSKRFGDTGEDMISSLVVDAQGALLAAGHFEGTIDFGGAPLQSAGVFDAFVAKLDGAGAHLASERLGGPGLDAVQGLHALGDGGMLLTIWFTGTVDLGGGPLVSAGGVDSVVAKLDAGGNHLWSKRIGDSFTDNAITAVDAGGNVVVAGFTQGAVDLGGGPLAASPTANVYLGKLDAAGNHLWSKMLTFAPGTSSPRALRVDGAGSIYLAGSTMVLSDGGSVPAVADTHSFLVKLAPDGQQSWMKQLPNTSPSDMAWLDLVLDTAGRPIVSSALVGSTDFGGGTLSCPTGRGGLFLLALDSDGEHLWSRAYGDDGAASYAALAVDTSHHLFLAGTFSKPVDFGGGALSPTYPLDSFLVKLAL